MKRHASMSKACAECGDPVRQDWSACPWCGTSFVWSLGTAADAVETILREAGAPALARRFEVRYSRARTLGIRVSHAGRDDRLVHLATPKLRPDKRALPLLERVRRTFGGDRWFALEHPLHIALHELGHLFETFLDTRGQLDHDEARDHVGELDLEVNPYPTGSFAYLLEAGRAWWRADDPAFVSAYATVHPCEDFAETFAVVAFLRADVPTLRAFARQRGRGPDVLRAMEWMAGLLRAYGA